MYLASVGDDASPSNSSPTPTLRDALNSEIVSTASSIALAYHGYKRSGGSIFWSLVYAAAGRWFPVEAVPIAIAQGFGERKACP